MQAMSHTTLLEPVLAHFTLPGGASFTVDVMEADLRLYEIDRQCKDDQAARWKAVGDYVFSLSGAPCSTSMAYAFYSRITESASAWLESDKKKRGATAALPSGTELTQPA